jgi:tetratricopeptide (TPR) repeat protein
MDYLSLCLICKDENDYLSEWLDYHILMGVDRFYIYDNESQVSLRETLKDYIERGWVAVMDIPGKAMQLYAYDHCLQTFGTQTFWLGFIDTDEFFVPKTSCDLKELLRGYEEYAGLAVNMLFFGSSGYVTRPAVGQIAAYTRRTHTTYKDNEQVKSIVQPGRVLMPNSPHDFTFKEGAWCVNEGFLRVDYQRFPNHTDKIQLNHYFCRSQNEVNEKLRRGNSGDIPWARRLFEVVNRLATCEDTSILQNLERLFQKSSLPSANQTTSLLEKMADMANTKYPTRLEYKIPKDITFRSEIIMQMDLEAQSKQIYARGDLEEIKQFVLKKIQNFPQKTILYTDLAICYLKLADPANAWLALTQAWQLSPNSYSVLFMMVYYFLWINNFQMAENTCRLLLDMAPHDLTVLGFLTEALIGQGRYEEAIKVGSPVVELSAQLGELPQGMGINLVKKMADYLLEKKDFTCAVQLWEAGLKCQPDDVTVLLELSQAQLLAGLKTEARQRLTRALNIAPQNKTVLTLLKQVDVSPAKSPGKKKGK